MWSELNNFIKFSESVRIFKKRIKSADLSQLIDNTCRDCFSLQQLIPYFLVFISFIIYISGIGRSLCILYNVK